MFSCKFKSGVVILAVLVLASVTLAQPPQIIDSVTILGTVEGTDDGQTSAPIENALVIVTDGFSIDRTMDTAYTDAHGNYAFINKQITSMMITITATAPGYQDSTAFFYMSQVGDTLNLDFVLREIDVDSACVVMGAVLEQSSGGGDVPVEGAVVSVRPLVGIGPNIPTYTDVTDASGDFEILAEVGNWPSYVLTVVKDGYQTYMDTITLVMGDTLRMGNISLEPVIVSLNPGKNDLQNSVKMYPNPFNTSAGIRFSTGNPELGMGSVFIYNMTGKLVWSHVARRSSHVTWDGCDYTGHRIAKGSYLVVLRNSHKIVAQERIILR
jgi:hypothetical protein